MNKFERFKEVLIENKVKLSIGTFALVSAIPSVPHAASGQAEAVTTALTTVATDITATITAIAPVALGIVGVFLTWKYGMKFFKSVSK